MNRQKMTKFFVVFALAGVTGLGACTSQQRTDSSRTVAKTSTKSTTSSNETAMAKPVRRGSWPTQRSSADMSWSSVAYPTGDAATSVLGIEKGMPREVRANAPFETKILVSNLTNAPLASVEVQELLDSNFRMTSSNPAARTGAGGAATWNLGALGPGESKMITITGTAPGEGQLSSCTSASYNSQLCSTLSVVEPKLRVTKTGPAEVMACDEICYNYEVTNVGTGTITNVRVTDTLATGLTAADGSRTLSQTIDRLEAGQSRRFKGCVSAARPGNFSSNVRAMADGVSAESAPVSTLVRQPKLTITKSCASTEFIGRPLRYEITVANTGDGEARDVVIEETMGSGLQFVNASDGGTARGGKLVWNLGTMRPNATKKVTYSARSGGAGTFASTASVRGYCADRVSDSCETRVTGIPAILLEVIDLEDPIPVGENETYVITVTNQGSAPDTNIRLTCTLENQEAISATGATRGTARGNSITFEALPSLAPKEKATFRVVVKAVRAGDTRFKVSMLSDELTRPVEETEATNQYE